VNLGGQRLLKAAGARFCHWEPGTRFLVSGGCRFDLSYCGW
jgi:hypothetical protein